MISKYTYQGLTWVDLESPTREEIETIRDEYALPSVVTQELYTETLRSKVDLYDNLIYLVLHFPVLSGLPSIAQPDQEIDFIIGEKFFITIRYSHISSVYEFAKLFEATSLLNRGIGEKHAGYLFAFLIREMYSQLDKELDHVNESLRFIENKIFEGQEEKMVRTISETNRKLLDFKQALRFHGDILHSFEGASKNFFGGEFCDYLATVVIGEYNKLRSLVDSHKEILDDLRETNDSLVSTKTNETMRTLTIMTFVMLPITLITGVFGMNTSSKLVFIQDIRDFVFIVAAMTLTGLTVFFFFKIKRWI